MTLETGGSVPPTAPPDLAVDETALFLDFDGTLVDIAARPDAIEVSPGTIELLAALERTLDGALAIVSGRDIPDLDHYLAPLQLCVAGVHGLVRRDAQGRRRVARLDHDALCRFRTALEERIAGCDGLILEEKTGALALHYRARPELAETCAAAVAAALATADAPDLMVVSGKMVIETRLNHHSKGTAIAAYMDEPPFRDRRPVFIGDDVTDEDGFSVVKRLGGIAVKVGDGDTIAPYRIASPAGLRAWLAALAGVSMAVGGGAR
jgi:trehalose 6-phosphate phosphatase